MIKNVANQAVGEQLVDATTGAAFVGVVTVYVTGDAGAQAIGSVGSGLCTSEGNGYFTYLPAQAETNYDLVAFTFIGSGAVPRTLQFETITPTQAAALALSSGGTLLTYTGRDLIEQALIELMIYAPGDSIPGDEARYGLSKLTRLLDNLNADRQAVYANTFTAYTITPSLQPHTIGPSAATWTATQRPETIDGANLILTTVSPSIRVPLSIRDKEWWLNQTVQGLTSSIPTDLYYDKAWPNGNVNIWPVPTVAYQVELLARIVIAQMALTDVVSFPPGYLDFIILTLAKDMAGGFEKSVSPDLASRQNEAKVRVYSNNLFTPRMRTADGGQSTVRNASSYNYLTGMRDL